MKIHMSENFTKRIFFISFKINNAEEKLIAAPSLQPALVLPQWQEWNAIFYLNP